MESFDLLQSKIFFLGKQLFGSNFVINSVFERLCFQFLSSSLKTIFHKYKNGKITDTVTMVIKCGITFRNIYAILKITIMNLKIRLIFIN